MSRALNCAYNIYYTYISSRHGLVAERECISYFNLNIHEGIVELCWKRNKDVVVALRFPENCQYVSRLAETRRGARETPPNAQRVLKRGVSLSALSRRRIFSPEQ